MVKVNVGDMEYYMDGYLHNNLVVAKERIKDDWDFIMVIDGMERGGKSVFAQQLAKFVDPSFNIKRIVFNHSDFEKRIREAEPFTAVVYDEAYSGLGSRATMSLINRTLVRMLTEIGYKNLFVFIVLPSFFDLDRYVALWRARALFHIYTGDKWERGYFKCYDKEKMKYLYVEGKKLYDYTGNGRISPSFFGRFTKFYTVNKEEYLQAKRKANEQASNDKDVSPEEFEDLLFKRVMQSEGLTNAQKAAALGIDIPAFYYRLKKYNAMLAEEAKSINT